MDAKPRVDVPAPIGIQRMSEGNSLTVAIPSFNGEPYIEPALRSILDQTFQQFDLLLCDDGSTDHTIERARHLAGSRLRVEANAQRLGLAGNWNRCIALADTPLVALVHQDDVLLPPHLAIHVPAMLERPALGMSFGAALPIDSDGRTIDDDSIEEGGLQRFTQASHTVNTSPQRKQGTESPPHAECSLDSSAMPARTVLGTSTIVFQPGEFLNQLVDRNPVRCSSVVLRKVAAEAVGGFDPSWKYVVDWEFWWRLGCAWEVNYIGEATTQFRWHPASETHRFKRGLTDLSERARLLDSIRDHSFGGLARLGDARLARAYLNRAYDALKAGRPALARRAWRLACRYDPTFPRAIWKLDPKLALGLVAAERFPWLIRSARPPLSAAHPPGDNDDLNRR